MVADIKASQMKDHLFRDVFVGDFVFYNYQVYEVIKITMKSLKLDRVAYKQKTKPCYAKSDVCVLLSKSDVDNWLVLWKLKN
jgi:hypothetical protein